MDEPGLDLHEWVTRWEELEEEFADDPEEALPGLTRFIEELLVERGFQLDEPVTAEGEDPDVIRQFLAARQLARLVEAGRGDAEDCRPRSRASATSTTTSSPTERRRDGER